MCHDGTCQRNADAVNNVRRKQIAANHFEDWTQCMFAQADWSVFAAGSLHGLSDGFKVGKSEKLYSLTGTTGSLMYMAPEARMPYHCSDSIQAHAHDFETPACSG